MTPVHGARMDTHKVHLQVVLGTVEPRAPTRPLLWSRQRELMRYFMLSKA